MPSNDKEYMKEYMKRYNERNSFNVICPICDLEVKKYNLYAHKKSKIHKLVEKKLKEIDQPI